MYWDSARVSIQSQLRTTASDADLRVLAAARSQLAVVLAGLGRSEEAYREVAATLELEPIRIGAFQSPLALEHLAHAYALLGNEDNALMLIERLLSIPSRTSTHVLRIDPRWDPIRSDPRFRALLVKYANLEPVR